MMKSIKFLFVLTLLIGWNESKAQLKLKTPDLEKVKEKAKDKLEDKKSDVKDDAKDKKEEKVKESENKISSNKNENSNLKQDNSNNSSEPNVSVETKVEKPSFHPLHQKNISKVVFSSKRLDKSSTDETEIKSLFKLTEPIFGLMYLSQTIEKEMKSHGEDPIRSNMAGRVFFVIDGIEYNKIPGMSSIYINEDLTYDIGLGNIEIESNKKSFNFSVEKAFAYVISKLPAGNHKVKIIVKPSKYAWEKYSSRPLPVWAEGEFDLSFTEAERDLFVKKNGLKFEEWEKAGTDAVFNNLVKKQVPTAIRTFITEPIVKRNQFGTVTHRIAYLRTIEKNGDGDTEIIDYNIHQEFVGGKWENKVSVSESKRFEVNIAHQNFK